MARGKQRKGAQADRPGQPDPTAPLDGAELLTAARPVLALLREDLGRRAEDAAVERALRARYDGDKQANRTADSFAEWRDGLLAQVAASWFLSCVFMRTLEDRGLLGQARLAGPGATDSQTLFFQLAPSLTERDYLLFVFRELAELPAARALFDREHALVWQLSPSADAAKALLRLFRTPSADAPAFRFGQASTRFLGDLYQDLYEDVRKRYALLQTPDFIESFILDRTLEPAIERFGLDDTTLIDPTCGSGHFLLGAFDRLFDHRLRTQPGIEVGQAAHKALDAVFGADINPYAVAIARVRLTLAYLEKSGIRRLKDAPALPLHLVVADSLLHNPQHAQQNFAHLDGQSSESWQGDAFQVEDPIAARDVLGREYAAVVGNPPYITEKDSAKRETYRSMYPRSIAGKYSLAAPFCERFFQLARVRGSVGQITANSFMKREFGKKLIEDYLPSVNLAVVINTSGAYIPGHGTPTVLLFGTNEPPTSSVVRTVLAKNGEPSTPDDPARGEVWSGIANHWTELSFENDYISVSDTDRQKLAAHPWSLGGGGVAEFKDLLEERTQLRLGDLSTSIGFMAITGEDDVFVRPRAAWLRLGAEPEWIWDFGIGEEVRDWSVAPTLAVAFPYKEAQLKSPGNYPRIARILWPYRRLLLNRPDFGGKKYIDVGRTWFEYHQVPLERLKKPLSITFPFVATHNHFVLDRGATVFNRTAPIIKLADTATEEDHLVLLAYLNSSVACFWMKQVAQAKTVTTGDKVLQPDLDKIAYEFTGTHLEGLPVPNLNMMRDAVGACREIEEIVQARRLLRTATLGVVARHSTVDDVVKAAETDRRLLARAAALQEALDLLVYIAFQLVEDVELVGRARKAAMRAIQDRAIVVDPDQRSFLHGQSSIELSGVLWECSSSSRWVAFCEAAAFKRRWVGVQGRFKAEGRGFEDALMALARERVLDHAEAEVEAATQAVTARGLWEPLLTRPGVRLFQQATGLDEASGTGLATALENSAVPYLSTLRLAESGLVKHQHWLAVWEAQRAEDSGESSPRPEVPPRYTGSDFQAPTYFSLRGKLDVPNERFISYPGCESDEDGEPVYGWAGWNHLQRAQALASLYQKRKTDEGWTAERLTPMLAGLLELLPWIKQWHNEPNAEFGGLRMGDYFAQFLDGECQLLGLTHADLEAWRPTKKAAKKRAAKAAANPDDGDDKAARPKKPRKKKATIDDAHEDATDT